MLNLKRFRGSAPNADPNWQRKPLLCSAAQAFHRHRVDAFGRVVRHNPRFRFHL
jgi:hypothetical protein